MLPRTLEAEVMDTPDEARDYDAMHHGKVNRSFVDDFLAAAGDCGLLTRRLSDPAQPAEILDTGTGTALIPIELCTRPVACRIVAVDLSREMLILAEENVAAAGFERAISLEHVDAKGLPHADHSFDAVISNSIVHHVPQPQTVLAEMARVLRTGGLLFVRDLLRPGDVETLERLVETYAGEENAHQQQMFRDSLHAALTLDEVQSLLKDLSLPATWVRATSDRHWTTAGVSS